MYQRLGFVVLLSAAVILGFTLAGTGVNAQGSGEAIYKAKCATCHGPDGAGATPAGKATGARPLCSDEVSKESDADWTSIVVHGKNKMPSYDKKLSDAEVKDVVTYMRGLCKK